MSRSLLRFESDKEMEPELKGPFRETLIRADVSCLKLNSSQIHVERSMIDSSNGRKKADFEAIQTCAECFSDKKLSLTEVRPFVMKPESSS